MLYYSILDSKQNLNFFLSNSTSNFPPENVAHTKTLNNLSLNVTRFKITRKL